MILPLTPLRFLERAKALYGNDPGVICGANRFTYTQFAERCQKLGTALMNEGVQPGQRIAFLTPNCHRLLEAYYGVLFAKAVLVPVNIRLSPLEIAAILHDAEASVVFFDLEYLSLLEKIQDELPSVKHYILLERPPGKGNRPRWVKAEDYDQMLDAAAPCNLEFTDVDENSLAELFYTSGTTGEPKGVMLSHRSLYLHALGMIATHRIWDSIVLLHTIPLFHANGWGEAHTVTGVGGRHVMIRKFEPQNVCRLIESEKVTSLSMVPTMAKMLIRDDAIRQFDLSSLDWVLIGGATSSIDLFREIEDKLSCKAYVGYGLTETSPGLAISIPKPGNAARLQGERLRIQASTGHALLGVQLRVVDDEGREVPKNGEAVGEIIARSDGVSDGYWKSPENSKEAFQDGWLRTGDMAVWDADGFLNIVDRKKDIIISGGENISSIEVENVLAKHPSVAECAVIATPDEQWGEVPIAFIVLNEGVSTPPSELTAHVRKSLAGFKVPKHFEFINSLPKSGAGKILKKTLREYNKNSLQKLTDSNRPK